MKQIKLDESWDWDITGGRLVFLTGSDRIKQRVKQSLQTFLNEYFQDSRLGVGYFQNIFVKNPDYIRVRSDFVTAILRDDEVVQVTEINLETDSFLRTLSVDFKALTSSGEQIGDTLEVII